mgnify:FL=1|tara:strand:- start:561 stop:821 length:261 start_codon:yes stop_codon:yes gene_type:complete
MKRSSSTIPFGYRLKEDNTLEPIEKELSVLKEMKDGVKAGAFSLRGAVEILESQTGRKLSAMGLKKIIDKDKLKETPTTGILGKDK